MHELIKAAKEWATLRQQRREAPNDEELRLKEVAATDELEVAILNVPQIKRYDKASQLARLRLDVGLTGFDVEQRSGMPASHLSMLETGKIKNPKISTVKQLSELYGVSIETIIDALSQ